MNTWKSKLFGDNRFNFYGWILAGLLVIGTSLWLVIQAVRAGALQSSENFLLLAIYLVLLGHLGLALQSYHGRVARRIESEERKEEEDVA